MASKFEQQQQLVATNIDKKLQRLLGEYPKHLCNLKPKWKFKQGCHYEIKIRKIFFFKKTTKIQKDQSDNKSDAIDIDQCDNELESEDEVNKIEFLGSEDEDLRYAPPTKKKRQGLLFAILKLKVIQTLSIHLLINKNVLMRLFGKLPMLKGCEDASLVHHLGSAPFFIRMDCRFPLSITMFYNGYMYTVHIHSYY
uniref:Uncharacterized protein n=1 Tax=Glossina palpalis gambiensis TaxID=67801 RepID=A0A1B0BTX2_9MUSC